MKTKKRKSPARGPSRRGGTTHGPVKKGVAKKKTACSEKKTCPEKKKRLRKKGGGATVNPSGRSFLTPRKWAKSPEALQKKNVQ